MCGGFHFFKYTSVNIKVLSIGRTKETYIREGSKIYSSRISRYINLEWTELPDVKHSNRLSPEVLKDKEAEAMLRFIQPADVVVLLDERGKDLDSVAFAAFIEQKMLTSVKTLVFVIGGAYGFSATIRTRANHSIRLSSMTFSHQIIRIIFLEQLYRAFTIIRGEPYHNP